MTSGSRQRQRLVSRLVPMAEHRRQSKECESKDSTTVAGQAKPRSGGYGGKVVRPLVKVKMAFVSLVHEKRGTRSATIGTSSYPPASQTPYSIGMGMAPAF